MPALRVVRPLSFAATLVLGCHAPSPGPSTTGAPTAAPSAERPVSVCPAHSQWDGRACIGTVVECPPGTIFDEGGCRAPAAPPGEACRAGAPRPPPIAATDPSAKHRAELALYQALEPTLRACLSAAPSMRFEVRLEFAGNGRHEPIDLEYQRVDEVDCVMKILEASACLPPVENGWTTTWTFCARACTDNPYCTLCVP